MAEETSVGETEESGWPGNSTEWFQSVELIELYPTMLKIFSRHPFYCLFTLQEDFEVFEKLSKCNFIYSFGFHTSS